MDSSSRRGFLREHVRPDVGCRALGLCLGAVTIALADASGDTTRGWRVYCLVRLNAGELSEVAGNVIMELLQQAVPDLVAVVLDSEKQAYRSANGTWRLPAAALKAVVIAARDTDKLRLNACEEADAFAIAANRLRDSLAVPVNDASLVLAVRLAIWGAIEHGVTERRMLPPAPQKRRTS
jgi:hypothetical protein